MDSDNSTHVEPVSENTTESDESKGLFPSDDKSEYKEYQPDTRIVTYEYAENRLRYYRYNDSNPMNFAQKKCLTYSNLSQYYNLLSPPEDVESFQLASRYRIEEMISDPITLPKGRDVSPIFWFYPNTPQYKFCGNLEEIRRTKVQSGELKNIYNRVAEIHDNYCMVRIGSSKTVMPIANELSHFQFMARQVRLYCRCGNYKMEAYIEKVRDRSFDLAPSIKDIYSIFIGEKNDMSVGGYGPTEMLDTWFDVDSAKAGYVGWLVKTLRDKDTPPNQQDDPMIMPSFPSQEETDIPTQSETFPRSLADVQKIKGWCLYGGKKYTSIQYRFKQLIANVSFRVHSKNGIINLGSVSVQVF